MTQASVTKFTNSDGKNAPDGVLEMVYQTVPLFAQFWESYGL